MDKTEQPKGALLARGNDERTGAFDIWKLGALLLLLVLLMADVLTRQIGLLTESASQAPSGKATTNFFKIQVGDFRAEIQWNNTGKQE